MEERIDEGVQRWVLGGWIVPNAWIRERYGVTKGLDERIEEGILSVLAMRSQGRMTGILRRSMYASVLVVSQWLGR